ncbi:hypothetical protein ACQP60_04325 [Isoptericola variabilis]|uniref:hypothetical protein n=1 Tax=Isoptericola variabilis TaxID=139208 RepID=UPI003D1DEC05
MTATTPHRFDQCDATCTTDCGHCKGNDVLKAAATAVRDTLNDERPVTALDYRIAAAVLGTLPEHRDDIVQLLDQHDTYSVSPDEGSECECGAPIGTVEEYAPRQWATHRANVLLSLLAGGAR